MSNNEWVQEGTPREASWTREPTDYGDLVSPTEWDDYSAEQAVPVPKPIPQSHRGLEDAAELGSERQVDPRREAEPEPEAEVVAEPEAAAEPESQVVAEPEPEPEPQAEVATEPEPEAAEESESEPQAEVGTEPESQAEPAPEPQAEVATEPEPQAEPEPEPEPEAEVATEPEPQAEPQAQLDRGDAPPVVEDLEDDAFRSDGAPLMAALVPDALPGEATETTSDMSEEADAEDLDATRIRPAIVTETGDVSAESTTALPAEELVAATQTSNPPISGLFRAPSDETQVLEPNIPATLEAEAAEESRIAEQVRAEKEARDQRLGRVATSEANAVRDTRPATRRGVSGFGSFGLLVLRLVVAAVVGITAYQIVTQIDATSAYLAQQPLIPEPRLVAWILGFTLAGAAIFLVIGLAVRVVGVVLALIAGATLALLRWGSFSPFVAGQSGFSGDQELIILAIGVALLSLGGGRVGIDGALSSARANAKEAKLS